mmetsp:Transcript_75510/g.179359  ORF Transcript_75510/g.179359 Transcript_75510/m.179359 type:complete len:212 (-) Transcript_75510:45-680(-)
MACRPAIAENQELSPQSRRQDLGQEPVGNLTGLQAEVLDGIAQVPWAEREADCHRRFSKLKHGMAQLSVVVSESRAAVALHPSKHDKLTAGTYYTCLRHLRWVNDRCSEVEALSRTLEAQDPNRFEPSVAQQYSRLAVDIFACHHEASNLLEELMREDGRGFGSETEDSAQQSGSWLGLLLSDAMLACSSRACSHRDLDTEPCKPVAACPA